MINSNIRFHILLSLFLFTVIGMVPPPPSHSFASRIFCKSAFCYRNKMSTRNLPAISPKVKRKIQGECNRKTFSIIRNVFEEDKLQ